MYKILSYKIKLVMLESYITVYKSKFFMKDFNIKLFKKILYYFV
jgi:hypothetical protein